MNTRADIFWANAEKSDGCWRWKGQLDPYGYGHTKYQGHRQGAHRVAWQLAYGPIPVGLYVLHHCDNPRCVRPEHLFIGTQAENIRDMIEKGRFAVTLGEQQGGAKLTARQVAEIRRLAQEGWTNRAIAPLFGVTQSNVSRVVRRNTWGHVA